MGRQDTAVGYRPDDADDVSAQHGGRPSARESFGDTLRRLRLQEGMSLRLVVRRLGYSAHSAIADFESGRRLPSEKLVREYETLFAVPPGSLVMQRRRVLAEKAASDPAFGRHGEPRLPHTATPDSLPPSPADHVFLRSAALALIDALDGRTGGSAAETRRSASTPGGAIRRKTAADRRTDDPPGLDAALLLLLRAAMLHLPPI